MNLWRAKGTDDFSARTWFVCVFREIYIKNTFNTSEMYAFDYKNPHVKGMFYVNIKFAELNS